MASWPSFDAAPVGKGSDEYSAQLFAKAAPGPNSAARPHHRRLYPPGSTFKPVTAIASMSRACRRRTRDPVQASTSLVDGHQTYNNWDPFVNQHVAAHGALALVRHVLLRARRRLYDAAAGDSRRRSWARGFGFGAPTGLDLPGRGRARADAECAGSTFGKDPINNHWTPGDSVNSRSARASAGHAAADGALLRAARERRHARDAAPRRRRSRAPGGDVVKEPRFGAGRESTSTLRARDVRSGLRGVDPRRRRHVAPPSPASRSASPARPARRRSGPAAMRRLSRPLLVCGYAPIEDPQLVVCAVIEQGGFGGVGAAAARRGVRRLLPRQGDAPPRARRTIATARSVENASQIATACGSAIPKRRARRRRAGSTGCCSRPSPASSRSAAGPIRASRLRRRRRPSTRRAPARSSVVRSASRWPSCSSSTRRLPPLRQPTCSARVLADRARACLGLEAARGSSRWITSPGFNLQPSEIGKVIVIVVLAGCRRARARAGHVARRCVLVLLHGSPRAGVPRARPRHGDRLRRGVAPILFVAGRAWLQLAVIGALVVLGGVSCSGRCRRPASRAPAVPAGAPDGFLDPKGTSSDAATTRSSRSRPSAPARSGPRLDGATQTRLLPAGARHRLRLRVVRAARLRRRAFLLALYLLVWAGAAHRRRRRDLYRASSPAGSFGCCSRSSSTSA